MVKKIKWLSKLAVLLVALGFIGIGGTFAYYAKDLPSPASIQEVKIVESTKIYDRTGKILLYDIHGEQKRTIIPLQDMPAHVKYATIVAEDDDFYKHIGIDPKGIARATLSNIKGRAVTQGGSTITQQLIKNIYLSPERTIQRKVKEIILAIELELKYSKDEILDFYLNIVPYGSNAYGIEAASQTFFDKHADNLTISQAALLASLPKAPTYYSPFGNNPEKLEARHKYVLGRMHSLGYITAEQAAQAKNEKITYYQDSTGIKAPHFVMYIREHLEKNYGEDVLKSSGLRVVTTLDWGLQQEAEKIVAKWAETNEAWYGAKNAALVAIDPKTGHILAMVGSRDYFDVDNDGNVNVTTRLRQPGSSFKPFAYAAVFEKGYTPDTVIFDVETNFGVQGAEEYIPQNYDETFRGPLMFKEALAQSINLAAVKVLYLAGIKETIKLAKSMGITSLNDPSRYGLSLVLGGGEVTLLDETSAYGVFSQEGTYNKATGILSITSKDNGVMERFIQKPKRVLDPQISRLITSILSDNDLRAPMFGVSSYLRLAGIPSAAKTGTTQEYRDAWTVGYTPDITVGVWAGNNDNSKMHEGAGIKAAAPIWNEFMKKAYEVLKLEPRNFTAPEDIETEKPVLNGSLGGSIKVKIDKITGKLATEYTPPELIEEKSFYEPRPLLYFVQKDDPQGEAPENPSIDPQFAFWEEGVQKWAEDPENKNRVNKYNLGLEAMPKEYDDVHTKQTRPQISIIAPSSGFSISAGASITLSLEVTHVFDIKELEIFFDNKIIKTIPNIPPTISVGQTSITDSFITKTESFFPSFRIPSVVEKKNPHTIEVRIFDEVLNRGETELFLNIN